MSAGENLITSWIENGLDWKWVYAPSTTIIDIPADSQVLYNEHKHPEGALTQGIAAFDSPLCGIRVVSDPLQLDTGSTQSINISIIGGGSRTNVVAWASVPPTTPPGIYVYQLVRAVPWEQKIQFWLFNNDTLPHRFLIGGYTMAVLLRPRPEWMTGEAHRLEHEKIMMEHAEFKEIHKERLAAKNRGRP